MAVSVDFLQSIPYFADLGPLELQRIREHLRERSFEKGETIFYEGGVCQGLYIVKSGMVRIYKTSADGREQVLFIAKPNDSFNDVPIFDDGPNPATAEALEASVIYLLPKGEILALIKEFPTVAIGLLRIFAKRLRHLTMLAEDLSFKRVESRVAKILLQLAEPDASASKRRLTQQDIAAMVGTAREMVGRALKSLEEEGAIKRDRHRIIVVRPDLLRDLS